MPTSRRWLQFSLRTFFLGLTLVAVWLGSVANHAHQQRDAVNAIEATGGGVVYQWQLRWAGKPPVPGSFSVPVYTGKPNGPAWLRRIIGDDYFQDVELVVLSARPPHTEAEMLKTVPRLQRLRGLKQIGFATPVSVTTLNQLKAALPNCQHFPPPEIH